MTTGRPSDYSAEIAAIICERISDGQSVREIARDDDMPAMSTIFRWLTVHKDFQEQYARAKEAQAEHMAEQILDIADNASNDWMARKDGEGNETGWQVNGDAIQRSRLMVDSRKWLLSKLLPKKYGDKITTEHQGPDGGPVQIQKIERIVVNAPDTNR